MNSDIGASGSQSKRKSDEEGDENETTSKKQKTNESVLLSKRRVRRVRKNSYGKSKALVEEKSDQSEVLKAKNKTEINRYDSLIFKLHNLTFI